DSGTGTLTVSDGTNTQTFHLSGFSGTLQFSADGMGGTLITDPPASSPAATLGNATSHLANAVGGGLTGTMVVNDPEALTGTISSFGGLSNSDQIDLVDSHSTAARIGGAGHDAGT